MRPGKVPAGLKPGGEEMSNNFKKTVLPGRTDRGDVHCMISYQDGRMSISGVEGAKKNGDCRGSAGQCIDALGRITAYEVGWCDDLTSHLTEVWQRWHLNDMRPGCEHQRTLDTDKKITVTTHKWGPKYHDLRRRLERATDEDEAVDMARTLARVNRLFETIQLHGSTRTQKGLWPTEALLLLEEGYIAEQSVETKNAGWVNEREHPDGLLGKRCPECGYRYGHAWLKEEVPAEVLDFLHGLPDAARPCPWKTL